MSLLLNVEMLNIKEEKKIPRLTLQLFTYKFFRPKTE